MILKGEKLNKMTLEDYLRGSNGDVCLERDEYTVNVKLKHAGLILVIVHAFNTEYAIKDTYNRLYTVDDDGNPLHPSCFFIKDEDHLELLK